MRNDSGFREETHPGYPCLGPTEEEEETPAQETAKEQPRRGATTPAPKRAANGGQDTPKSRRTWSTIQNYLGRSSQKLGQGPPALAGRSSNKIRPAVSNITFANTETVTIEKEGCDTISPTYHNNTLTIPSSHQDHTILNNKKQNNKDTAPPVARPKSCGKKAGTPKQTRKKNAVVVADPKQRKLTEMLNKQSKQNSSSSSNNTTTKKVPCTYNKDGFCKQHRAKGQPRTISSLEYQDRGGGRGMGFVKIKKEIFLCNMKKLLPELPKNSTKSDNKVYLTNGLVTDNSVMEGNNFIEHGQLPIDYTSNIWKGLASARMDESESSEIEKD